MTLTQAAFDVTCQGDPSFGIPLNTQEWQERQERQLDRGTWRAEGSGT